MPAAKKKNTLPAQLAEDLISTLKARFEKHAERHPEIEWTQIEKRLSKNASKLVTLHEMEQSGGEPDVIGQDEKTGEFLFVDCSAESPKGRRSLCFDPDALESRKTHKPKHSALGMAAEIGIELLTEEQYRELQKLGDFDCKTSSWVQTPADIRALGGSLFCDRRFGHVFVYHNGAESYYGSRGFRGLLRV